MPSPAVRHGLRPCSSVEDSFISAGQNSEKTWLSFRWALENHPDAQLIFHQDGDTLVDWRQALPRFLHRIFPDLPPASQDLRRLVTGPVIFSFFLGVMLHLDTYGGFSKLGNPNNGWFVTGK